MNKTNYYNFLSWFCYLLKYYINNYSKKESINYKMFRKYCLKNKFLYELDENEEKKDNYFKYNLKADKTYNLLLEEMNNNIHGNGEAIIKIETMIRYLYFSDIIKFGSGLFGLA